MHSVIMGARRAAGNATLLALGAASNNAFTRTTAAGAISRGLSNHVYRPAMIGAGVGAGLNMAGTLIGGAMGGYLPTPGEIIGAGVRGGMTGGLGGGAFGAGRRLTGGPFRGANRLNRRFNQGTRTHQRLFSPLFGG